MKNIQVVYTVFDVIEVPDDWTEEEIDEAVAECEESIDELEEKTNIDFFHNLPDYIENNVENSYSLNDWNWK